MNLAEAVVFDTGPLRHFVTAGWLGALKHLCAGRPVLIPETVERELQDIRGELGQIAGVFAADWIQVFRDDDLRYVHALAEYKDRLYARGKNIGECGVLAMGKTYGCELILDDAAARRAAEDDSLKTTATVGLLCRAVREGQLNFETVESIADDLLIDEYFLPFDRGGFRQFVLREGLLDYDEISSSSG